MSVASFYAQGLRFTCKRCSACCRYDAGFVYLSKTDLKKLVLHTKMDEESFKKTYCRRVADWRNKESLSLKEKYNKDCIFWDNGCTVYEARPMQCVTFPFWENIIVSKKAWENAASGCPGMNKGVLHSEKEINQHLKNKGEIK
jgi:Fe-S-cluster containining protein